MLSKLKNKLKNFFSEEKKEKIPVKAIGITEEGNRLLFHVQYADDTTEAFFSTGVMSAIPYTRRVTEEGHPLKGSLVKHNTNAPEYIVWRSQKTGQRVTHLDSVLSELLEEYQTELAS